SDDDGRTWTAPAYLPARHGPPVTDPTRAGILLEKYHSSIDAGATWHATTGAERDALARIGQDQHDVGHPARLLRRTNGATLTRTSTGAWRNLGHERGTISFGLGAHVLFAVSDDGWLSRSTDDGRTWRRARQAGIPDGGRLAGGSGGTAWVQFDHAANPARGT